MNLFLVRHAETGTQYKGRYIGSTDVPISEGGYIQADKLAQRLSSFAFSSCYCSPMLRCRQTAGILKGKLGIGSTIAKDLAEVDFGQWEGATFDEICQRDPQLIEQWSDNVLEFTFPGGEHNQFFYNRIRAQLDVLLDCADDSMLVISHGGVIRVMICILLGLNFDQYLLFNVKPATYAKLDVCGKSAVLSGFNL